MFTAYFDASGKRDTRVLTVAGFVSDVRKWSRFDAVWESILKREEIPAFHMADFVARRPPFDRWQGRESDRDAFFRDLISAAVKYTNKAFSVMVPMRDYREADRRYCVTEFFGHPYALAGLDCVIKTAKWSRKNGQERTPIEFFFEDGDEGKGKLDEFLRRHCEIRAVFKSKKDVRPFQAADLIAWEDSKFVRIAQDWPGVEDKLRKSSLELDRHPNDSGVLDLECIVKTCENLSVPRRA
jgi:hypothetical protein